MIPVVPTELIHAIPVARLFIFRSVKFEQSTWPKRDNAFASFIEAVEQNPHLIRHIRDLSYNFSSPGHEDFFERVTLSSVKSFSVKHVSLIGLGNRVDRMASARAAKFNQDRLDRGRQLRKLGPVFEVLRSRAWC